MTLFLDEMFAPLQVVKKKLSSAADRSAYRVYKTDSEFVTVEAATALEAFRESGVHDPVRIVREIRFSERMVDQTHLVESNEFVETGAAVSSHALSTPIVVSPVQEPVQSTIAAVEVPQEALTPEDVDLLLNDKQT